MSLVEWGFKFFVLLGVEIGFAALDLRYSGHFANTKLPYHLVSDLLMAN